LAGLGVYLTIYKYKKQLNNLLTTNTMKKHLISLTLFFAIFQANAQKTIDQIKDEIREMEKRETISYIAQDYETLNNIVWADDIVVDSPINRINKSSTLLTKLLKDGIIKHKAIVRNIEELNVTETMVVSMGNEIVTNLDDSITNRRYTNIWILKDGNWRMSFRHANVICK
jgi:hypothetical protein